MLSACNKTSCRLAGRQGFTLIELLVVIVIIGMLVGISISYLSDVRQRAKELQTATNLNEIHKALEAFATDHNGMYPFRIRWFNNATVNSANFDPYQATDTGAGLTSDAPNFFSLGLIGGVKVVKDDFSDNTWNRTPTTEEESQGWYGMNQHKIIQPLGWDVATYRIFNQYSDPLVAMGYMSAYPSNPFMKRPMGNMFWAYGAVNGNLDKNVPSPNVTVTPGDFCYTFYYGATGMAYTDPPGVVEAKASYIAKSPTTTHDGKYYLDVVDSYQMWAYGILPMNGGRYVIYKNNAAGLVVKGQNEAKQDFNNNGIKDMYEMGMIAYYNRSGSNASQATTSGGSRVEF